MRTSPSLRAAVTAAAVALVAVPAAAAPAVAAGTYTLPLHQAVPITASGYDGHGDCPGIPDTQDGWNFVLPGNSTTFVKLTVTFQPGGQQVLTSFGPPSDKHANVASAPGAQLVSAVAEVTGGDDRFFNLSHTCPASSKGGGTPSSSPSGSPGPSTSPSTPGSSPSGSPSTSPSSSPSGSSSHSASPSASTSTSPSAGGSGSPSVTPAPSASASAAGGPSGLAFTGADIVGTVLVGVTLVGAGGVLVMRRRQTGRH